jgi:CDGSH-type Zn-finger protein
MADPVIAQKSPYSVTLDSGIYWWCQCGQSNNQPFCDGANKCTDFTPITLEISDPPTLALCGCKHSSNKLYSMLPISRSIPNPATTKRGTVPPPE